MALFSTNNSQSNVPYSPDDAYAALCAAALRLQSAKNYSLKDSDAITRRIIMKTGISFVSWGENITISIIAEPNGTSSISISSGTKTGTPFDFGKNNKNINEIMDAFSKQLKNYKQITPKDSSGNAQVSVAEELEKLASLKEKGILSQQEFDAQKKKLLGL